eukprot:scaffold14127_cov23-Tisochrysis_lutea.AAC.1
MPSPQEVQVPDRSVHSMPVCRDEVASTGVRMVTCKGGSLRARALCAFCGTHVHGMRGFPEFLRYLTLPL